MTEPTFTVLLIDAHDDAAAIANELALDEGFVVEHVLEMPGGLERLDAGDVDAVLLGLDGSGSLDWYGAVAEKAPAVPVIAVTAPAGRLLGGAAVRAGAEDHLVRGEMPEGLLPRSIRYAIDQHRLRRELRALETTDDVTGLPNLRGFVPVVEHHFRIADRTREPVVLIFVRLDELESITTERGGDAANGLLAEAADVVMAAIRDADYPARISRDTFCALLTGQAAGAEVSVLSRLVEAIAVRNAGRASSLALSVGSALYEPDAPSSLDEIIAEASRRMTLHPPLERSEGL